MSDKIEKVVEDLSTEELKTLLTLATKALQEREEHEDIEHLKEEDFSKKETREGRHRKRGCKRNRSSRPQSRKNCPYTNQPYWHHHHHPPPPPPPPPFSIHGYFEQGPHGHHFGSHPGQFGGFGGFPRGPPPPPPPHPPFDYYHHEHGHHHSRGPPHFEGHHHDHGQFRGHPPHSSTFQREDVNRFGPRGFYRNPSSPPPPPPPPHHGPWYGTPHDFPPRGDFRGQSHYHDYPDGPHIFSSESDDDWERVETSSETSNDLE